MAAHPMSDFGTDEDDERTDPGRPACTIIGPPISALGLRVPAPAGYALRYPPQLDDTVVIDLEDIAIEDFHRKVLST